MSGMRRSARNIGKQTVSRPIDPAVAKVLSQTFTRRVVARRADPMKHQQDDVG
jgi:hypothetical protein